MSDCKTLKIKDFHSFKIQSKSAHVLTTSLPKKPIPIHPTDILRIFVGN